MPDHNLKYVRFFGREVPVVLQNENGPCPLLAIANVLLLRDAIQLPPNVFQIRQEELVDILAEYLLDNNPVEPSSQYAANLQQNLQDVIPTMHKLTTGVDVNPKFSSVRGFEFTNETAIFDLFDISLVHGWIMDPEEDAAGPVGDMSYNQVMGKLISTLGAASLARTSSNISYDASLIQLEETGRDHQEDGQGHGRPVQCRLVAGESGVQLQFDYMEEVQTAVKDEVQPGGQPVAAGPSSSEGVPEKTDSAEARVWETVRDWMESNSSQLSMFGLFQLHQQLPEKELAVFFRNNHFNTIFKANRSLYILVTDQGYISEADLVWEKLESVNNDNHFCTGDFRLFVRPVEREQSVTTTPTAADQDLQYALAASLQQTHNKETSPSLLPPDFLSLAPQAEQPQHQHDEDFALALQLHEEEMQQQQQQQQQRPQPTPLRGGQDGSGAGQGHWHWHSSSYPRLPDSGLPSAHRQHAFPPMGSYGHSRANGGRRSGSFQAESGHVTTGSSEEPPRSQTLWSRFRKIIKF